MEKKYVENPTTEDYFYTLMDSSSSKLEVGLLFTCERQGNIHIELKIFCYILL